MMLLHDWGPSPLGHGDAMCRRCFITNREAAALGCLNECRAPEPKVIEAPMQTVDLQTGETTDGVVKWNLLPPPASACQVCAMNPAHRLDEPHNRDSLYYQTVFHAEHGRMPTWRDALAHCPPEVQKTWEEELRNAGAWEETQ